MLNVFDWLRKRSPTGRTAANLYGSIVAQARQPVFYTSYGVPDTAVGRYEMLVVHMHLVLQGLARQGEAAESVRRALVECFVTDVDDSLRQLAVGDMSVPRKVKKAAAGLRERDVLYQAARADGSPVEAVAALLDSVFSEDRTSHSVRVTELAAYILEAARSLDVTPPAANLGFPDPADLIAGRPEPAAGTVASDGTAP